MKHDPEHIPEKWRRIIHRVARGEDWRAAARAEACSVEYSKVIRTRMMRHPAVVRELEGIRMEGMKLAAYGLSEAMKEADSAALFAREKGNPMALVKACELRAKLSGLLIDRIEVVPLDLRGALERAKHRVIDIIASPSQHVELGPASNDTVRVGSAHWELPTVPGNRPDSERAPVEL